MGGTGKNREFPNKDGKSSKLPLATAEATEDGDIATPKRDLTGDDLQRL